MEVRKNVSLENTSLDPNMKVCLETSCIIGFLNCETDCQPIERLLTLAEDSQVELYVSDFAWQEIVTPLDQSGVEKMERLRRVAKYLPKVARLGEWVLGEHVLGHDNSPGIERGLSHASRPDREQFLSYAAVGLDYFVTKDHHYLKRSVRTQFVDQYGFEIGMPEECLAWLEKQGNVL